MKRLLILRHAKSSWADSDLSDFDRPLNERGLRAAPFMGRYILENGFVPDAIVSSPAKRAAETAELVRSHAGIPGEIRYDENLYEASPHTLRKVVANLSDDLDSVMVVGHNTGIESFIHHLTGEHVKVPTAALAVIDLDVNSWSEVKHHHEGLLVTLLRPKALM